MDDQLLPVCRQQAILVYRIKCNQSDAVLWTDSLVIQKTNELIYYIFRLLELVIETSRQRLDISDSPPRMKLTCSREATFGRLAD